MPRVRHSTVNIHLPISDFIECLSFCEDLVKMADNHGGGHVVTFQWALDRLRHQQAESETAMVTKRLANDYAGEVRVAYVDHRTATRSFHNQLQAIGEMPDILKTGVPALAQDVRSKCFADGLSFLPKPAYQVYIYVKHRIELLDIVFVDPLRTAMGTLSFDTLRAANEKLGSALHMRGELLAPSPEKMSLYYDALRNAARTYIMAVHTWGLMGDEEQQTAELLLQPLAQWTELSKIRHPQPRARNRKKAKETEKVKAKSSEASEPS